MSRAIKRKIVVEGILYFWTLKSNSLDKSPIKVHSEKVTKSILYIDPFTWHFIVRPKIIREAILFALSMGWKPSVKGTGLTISKTEKGFYKLPKGISFDYQIAEEE